MKIACLSVMPRAARSAAARSAVAVSVVAASAVLLSGCGANSSAPEAKAFELNGSWLYLGPSDGPHTLTVSHTSMLYADVDGHWSSSWTIKTFDNDAHYFQILFGSGTGTYLPVGQSMSGAYDVSGALLTVQLANGLASYPELHSPGTCTNRADGAPVPDCRLYIKQN
jgi:hypothetical protein